MPNSPTLIGSAQAAKKFGVHRATFNRWVDAGEIPVVGQAEGQTGARMFDADVIAELVAQRNQEAAS